jgi:MFS family permease
LFTAWPTPLTDTSQNIITLVFFITYVLFQPPATVLCRKLGPRPFLAFITLAWGVVMIGMGFPQHWHSMIGLRLLLGVFEAGFFPG